MLEIRCNTSYVNHGIAADQELTLKCVSHGHISCTRNKHTTVELLAQLAGAPPSEVVCTSATTTVAKYIYKMGDMGKFAAAEN